MTLREYYLAWRDRIAVVLVLGSKTARQDWHQHGRGTGHEKVIPTLSHNY